MIYIFVVLFQSEHKRAINILNKDKIYLTIKPAPNGLIFLSSVNIISLYAFCDTTFQLIATFLCITL